MTSKEKNQQRLLRLEKIKKEQFLLDEQIRNENYKRRISDKLHNNDIKNLKKVIGKNEFYRLKNEFDDYCSVEYKRLLKYKKELYKITHPFPSKNESLIAGLLTFHNIEFITQKTFDMCKDKSKLRFDFYLPKYNTCIEYHGEDHYMHVNRSGHMSMDEMDERLEDRRYKDSLKKAFCKKNNIRLIVIPYWEKDDLVDILTGLFS